MRQVSVARKSNVSFEEIAREHLHGRGKPVIITDGTERWPARAKWTFEFFKNTYGSDLVTTWLGPGSSTGRITKLATYIDFLDRPMEEFPGIWIGKDGRPLPVAPGPLASPLYLLGWQALQKHPELCEDITPAPYFVLDLVAALSPALREILERTSRHSYTEIFIGPVGSLSTLHRDYWKTHAYLAQIRGRKRAILFSPEDSDFIYNGQVNPEQPDFERFPLFDRATAYECVIESGDTLLMPANWWHHVRALENSITISHNFFNDTNLTEHITAILRNLPALVEGLEQSSKLREELRIQWRSLKFTASDT